jgi:hypothetical protein
MFAKSKRIAIVVSEDWLQRVGTWRKQQADFPTLSDAIRKLVDQALDARADKPKPSKAKGRQEERDLIN